MEAFIGKVRDVGAHQGIVVTDKGFTKAAETLAKRCGIQTFVLRDTRKPTWPDAIRVRLIIDNWTLAVFHALVLDENNVPVRTEPGQPIRLGESSNPETEITIDALVDKVWRNAGELEGRFEYSFPEIHHPDSSKEASKNGCLELGFTATLQRFVRPASLETVALIETASGKAHTDAFKIVAPSSPDIVPNEGNEIWKEGDAPFGLHMQSVRVTMEGELLSETRKQNDALNAALPRLPLVFTVKSGPKPLAINLGKAQKSKSGS